MNDKAPTDATAFEKHIQHNSDTMNEFRSLLQDKSNSDIERMVEVAQSILAKRAHQGDHGAQEKLLEGFIATADDLLKILPERHGLNKSLHTIKNIRDKAIYNLQESLKERDEWILGILTHLYSEEYEKGGGTIFQLFLAGKQPPAVAPDIVRKRIRETLEESLGQDWQDAPHLQKMFFPKGSEGFTSGDQRNKEILDIIVARSRTLLSQYHAGIS